MIGVQRKACDDPAGLLKYIEALDDDVTVSSEDVSSLEWSSANHYSLFERLQKSNNSDLEQAPEQRFRS